MLAILENRTYRHLFLAQVIALVGTGLATVALGLLAFELAGAEAGAESLMKRQVSYQWRLREVMATRDIFAALIRVWLPSIPFSSHIYPAAREHKNIKRYTRYAQLLA